MAKLANSYPGLPSGGGCRFLSVGRMSAARDWSMKNHLHGFHEMIVGTRGRQYVVIRGREMAAEAGEVLFYPARTPHAERTDPRRPHECTFMGFRWSGYRPGRVPLKLRDRQGRIAALVGWLYDEHHLQHTSDPSAEEAFLSAVLAEYLRLAAYRSHDIVERVRAHARAHLAESLSLEDLAAHAGLSKYHFARRYKELTGRSPMADVRRIRLEAARNLLLSSDLPLKAIAPRVGLANEYHLSRLLRKCFGAGARQMRRYAKAD